MTTPPTIRVLAALIQRDGRWLLGLRPFGKRHAGRWEFPGGKVEPGETDAEAMARELREELGLELRALGAERCVKHDADSPFEITFVETEASGTPMALEHAALAWVSVDEFGAYPLAPSDVVCAGVLAGGQVPHEPHATPQHDTYLEQLARDAANWRVGQADTPSFLAYVEYACRLESVRPAATVLLRALAAGGDEVEPDARAALHAMADRIATMPGTPPRHAAAAPARASRVLLTHLAPGERIRVLAPFRTFDGDMIEAGRTLTFVDYTLFPYDDGYTVRCVEAAFRLSGNDTDQAAVLDNTDGRYFAPVTE